MQTITLIRHLPTEWNKQGLLQGKRNIDISYPNNKIQEEIQHNIKLLSKLSPFDLVLASTLKRTQQTAKWYGYLFKIEELLDELDFGPFEGVSKRMLYKEYGNQWICNPGEIILGESLNHLEQRIRMFIDKYKEYNNLLVFGHGAWIRAFVSLKQYGHINEMNKITVENNKCMVITTTIVDSVQ